MKTTMLHLKHLQVGIKAKRGVTRAPTRKTGFANASSPSFLACLAVAQSQAAPTMLAVESERLQWIFKHQRKLLATISI